jgi:glycerol-3-phosphate acyltransferase PlsY
VVSTFIVVFAAYALGCFSAGYYLVYFYSRKDVREFGSASTGATNVGRQLGTSGFLTTLLIDGTKGALGVWAAQSMGFDAARAMLILIAVVAGHIWPLQLRRRGGKGIAPALGGILLFDYRLAAALILVCTVGYGFTRRFTLSGLVAVTLSPIVAMVLGYSDVVIPLLALALVILIAHRENLQEIFAWKSTRGAKNHTLSKEDA